MGNGGRRVYNEDLTTYCGVYGGTCAYHIGHNALRETASLLSEIVDALGFPNWMPEIVKDFDFKEFYKGLAFFSDPESWLVCTKCCKDGKGRPDCPMRNCCRERGLDICFDCDEFPCDKVAGDSRMIQRGEEYKKLGKDEWWRTQVEKAKLGFEHHTEKYYQIQVDKKPEEKGKGRG
jgi:hypothetical protein